MAVIAGVGGVPEIPFWAITKTVNHACPPLASEPLLLHASKQLAGSKLSAVHR